MERAGHHILRLLWEATLDTLFPPHCAACANLLPPTPRRAAICERCFGTIALRDGFSCPRCGARLPPPLASTHPRCHPREHFILAAAAGYANPAVRALIRTLKYERTKMALAPLLKVLLPYLAATLRGAPSAAGDLVIVPIPLHPRRLRERGFNQAALIAEALTGTEPLSRAAVLPDALARTRNTPPQAKEANEEKRRANVAHCFTLKRPELIRGKTVFLVDDVFTSGATMKEAAEALQGGGANGIIGVVVARA
ncbi:MAG: phosphoribosyltransferase family protein [Candidatus Jorgensenbacteria bacterium]